MTHVNERQRREIYRELLIQHSDAQANLRLLQEKNRQAIELIENAIAWLRRSSDTEEFDLSATFYRDRYGDVNILNDERRYRAVINFDEIKTLAEHLSDAHKKFRELRMAKELRDL